MSWIMLHTFQYIVFQPFSAWTDNVTVDYRQCQVFFVCLIKMFTFWRPLEFCCLTRSSKPSWNSRCFATKETNTVTLSASDSNITILLQRKCIVSMLVLAADWSAIYFGRTLLAEHFLSGCVNGYYCWWQSKNTVCRNALMTRHTV